MPGEECDDANINDNDGCDAFCSIEEGFECNETCVDIRRPTATLVF